MTRNGVDSARTTIIILTLVLLIQFVGIFDHSLWPPDEPRVAEVAREMSISGNYLIPQFSLKPVLEHPFLYYAVTSAWYRIFGTSPDGVGRIASLIFALGTLFTVFLGMRRAAGIRSAGFACIILATSFVFFQTSHKMLVDNAVCFCITLAFFAFLHGYLNFDRRGFKIFWLALVLAFLAKGFFGVAFIAVTIIPFLSWQRDWSVIRRSWFIPGILSITAIICLWAWLLYLEGGKTYLRIFFLNNQFFLFIWNPYNGFNFQDMGYYLKKFWVAAAPWSLLFIPAFIFGRGTDTIRRFLLFWFFAGLCLLCLISVKREFYMIHLLPAMACLISLWFEKIIKYQPSRIEKIFLAFMVVQLATILLALPLFFFIKLRGSLLLTAFLLVLSLGAVWFLFYKRSLGWVHTSIITCALLYLIWTPPIFTQLDQYRSYKDVFIRIGQLVSDKPVIGFHLSDTVEALSPFYGGFYVDHIMNRHQFETKLTSGNPFYILVIPWRIDEKLSSLISTYAHLAVPDDFRNPRNLEVWEVYPSLLFPLPEIEDTLPFHNIFHIHLNPVE